MTRHQSIAALCGVVLLATAPIQALAQEKTVRYGISAISLNHGPALLAAADSSIMGKYGIKMEAVDFRGSANNCIAALLSGAIEVCQSGTTTGVDAAAEGAKIKAIAVSSGPVAEIVLSKKAAEATGLKVDAPIEQRMKALKGMRFVSAGPGSGNYTILVRMLKDVGLTMQDLKFATLNDGVAMMESIRNDRIDGTMWGAGTLGRILASGEGVRWVATTSSELPSINRLPFVTAYARADWVEANPELAANVHKALVDGLGKIINQPDDASKAMKAKHFPDLDPTLWEDGFSQVRAAATYFTEAKTTRQGWDDLLALQKQNTGKDYTAAAFEELVMPFARSEK